MYTIKIYFNCSKFGKQAQPRWHNKNTFKFEYHLSIPTDSNQLNHAQSSQTKPYIIQTYSTQHNITQAIPYLVISKLSQPKSFRHSGQAPLNFIQLKLYHFIST